MIHHGQGKSAVGSKHSAKLRNSELQYPYIAQCFYNKGQFDLELVGVVARQHGSWSVEADYFASPGLVAGKEHGCPLNVVLNTVVGMAGLPQVLPFAKDFFHMWL